MSKTEPLSSEDEPSGDEDPCTVYECPGLAPVCILPLTHLSLSLHSSIIIIIFIFFLRPLAQSRRLKIKQLWLDMALTQI